MLRYRAGSGDCQVSFHAHLMYALMSITGAEQ